MSSQVFSDHAVIFVKQVAASISILRVERNSKHFHAGQHIPIRIPSLRIIRDLSIYSSEEAPYIEFLVRHISTDTFTNALLGLKKGNTVELGDAIGVMTIEHPDASYWFVATGLGIAPFHSIVQSQPDLDYCLVHGIRQLEDSFDATDYKQQCYTRCVTRDDGGEFNGRVTSFLKNQELPKSVTYFISGGTEMVFETIQILLQQNVQRWNIKSDQL